MTKEERKEYNRQWYLKNREKRLEQTKQYYLDNKERQSELRKQRYQNNREKELEQAKQYHQTQKGKDVQAKASYKYRNTPSGKMKIYERERKYCQTQNGRANYLLKHYRTNDKKYNRGECTLTIQWIVDNIFSQPCHYCGETDWKKLGCDRIDNNLPHTPDNVVPCCYSCNTKRHTKLYEDFIKEYK